MTTPNNTVAGLPEKLLPCPFCGSSASRGEYDTSRGDAFVVCCSNRDCHADVYTDSDSRESADAAWNRRASSAPSAGVVDDAMEALRWYAEQAELCRKLGRDGDAGRQALDADGGKRARAALQHPAAPSVSPAVAGDGLPRFVVGQVKCWEAVEQTLNQVSPGWDAPDGSCTLDRACEAIRRLASSAPQGEPIGYIDPEAAFLFPAKDGCVLSAHFDVVLVRDQGGKYTQPIYTTPPPAPAAEQGESIARKFDRDVLEPLRKKDRATQPEARGVEGMVPNMPGNWPEDATHENGDYECNCVNCGATFYGHKRRVVCKVCAPNPVRAEQPDAVSSQHIGNLMEFARNAPRTYRDTAEPPDAFTRAEQPEGKGAWLRADVMEPDGTFRTLGGKPVDTPATRIAAKIARDIYRHASEAGACGLTFAQMIHDEVLAAAPAAPVGVDATDAEVRAWTERHGIDGALANLTDARCAFEDAQTAALAGKEGVA